MVGVRNEASAHPEQREGLDLQVRRVPAGMINGLKKKIKKKEEVKPELRLVATSYQEKHVTSLVNHVFIEGDLTVVLLVDIQVLHQAFVQKVFKVSAGKNSRVLSL